MDNYLKLLPLGLFFVYCSKLLYFGANLTDAPILLILAGLSAFYEYKFGAKKFAELNAKISELEQKQKDTNINLEDVRNHVGSLKLGQQVRLTR